MRKNLCTAELHLGIKAGEFNTLNIILLEIFDIGEIQGTDTCFFKNGVFNIMVNRNLFGFISNRCDGFQQLIDMLIGIDTGQIFETVGNIYHEQIVVRACATFPAVNIDIIVPLLLMFLGQG